MIFTSSTKIILLRRLFLCSFAVRFRAVASVRSSQRKMATQFLLCIIRIASPVARVAHACTLPGAWRLHEHSESSEVAVFKSSILQKEMKMTGLHFSYRRYTLSFFATTIVIPLISSNNKNRETLYAVFCYLGYMVFA